MTVDLQAVEPQEIKWGIWQIEESLQDLEVAVGNVNIYEDYQQIANENRRRQWLAARCLLNQLLPKPLDEPTIFTKDEHGKLHLLSQEIDVSISHSGSLAAAATHSKGPIGIDIEKISGKVRRVARKFLSEEEGSAHELSNEALTQFWCIKEATYKWYGKKHLSFKENIKVLADFEQQQFSVSVKKDHSQWYLKAHSYFFEGFAVGLVY